MGDSIGGDEAIIVLDNVRAEPRQLMGEKDRGFAIAMSGVSLGRMYNMGRAVGLGRWALDKAVDYAQTRTTFGRPLSDHQGLMFPLANAAMEVYAGHLMAINAARLLDQGARATKEVSMGKAFCVAAASKAIEQAMQVHGAMGFTNEMGFNGAWKEVRVVHVADGSNEILRRTIINQFLKGDTEL